MALPSSLAQNTATPGVAVSIRVGPEAGTAGAGTRMVTLLAPVNTAGSPTLAAATPTKVTSLDALETLAGVGSLAALQYQALRQAAGPAFGSFETWVVAPAASGGNAATQTLTLSGTVTSAMTLFIRIHGYELAVPWAAGVLVADMRTLVLAEISRYSRFLHVTAAAAVSAGVIDITAKSTGPQGNDITLKARLEGGAGGAVAVGGAKLAGGTTEIDITASLAALLPYETWHYVPAFSSADVESASTSNSSRLEAHVVAVSQGIDAQLVDSVHLASNGSSANALTGLATRADRAMFTQHWASGDEEIPGVLSARDCGGFIRAIEVGDPFATPPRPATPNCNQLHMTLPGRVGAGREWPAAKLSADTLETLLRSGLTAWTYRADGTPVAPRPVWSLTSYGGLPYHGGRDRQRQAALNAIARDLRANIPQLGLYLAADDAEIPPGNKRYTATPAKVRDWIIARLRTEWVDRLVVDPARLQAAIDAETILVEINATDAGRLDLLVPGNLLAIWAQTSLHIEGGA